MQNMFKNVVIASECVTNAHPDKIADRIADSILDECVIEDANSRTGIEVMVKDNIVTLGGEINTNAYVNYDDVVRGVYAKINFPASHNLKPENIKVINLIGKQSHEISEGVDKENGEIGAGDQGFVVGFASNETPSYMPLGHYVASCLCRWIEDSHVLGPDAKSQVVVKYDGEGNASIIHILVSAMNCGLELEDVRNYVETSIRNGFGGIDYNVYKEYIKDKNFPILVNPCGSWEVGGPISDCGVTGRKIVVDQYGGYCNVGGGAFSGKDLSKVDRSGAYAARYIAKCIVAAGVANVAKVEMSYAIGKPEPISINVILDKNQDKVSEILYRIKKFFPTKVCDIIKAFSSVNGNFSMLSESSHFGLDEEAIPNGACHPCVWEITKNGKQYFEDLA